MPFHSRLSRLLFGLALVLALGRSCASAQPRFSIHGTLTDATGATVSPATVQLQSPAGSLTAETLSTATGEFELLNIPAGSYTLFVPASQGFAAHSLPLRLSASIPALKIKLSLESVNQSVYVAADPSLSTEASANSDVVAVSGDSLQKLPVFDQDYIAMLTPFLDPASGG